MKIWQLAGLFLYIGVVLLSTPQTSFAEAICDVFTVTPDTAAPGDFVTLDWVTTNTISVEIDGLGTVATSGSALFEVPNSPGLFSIGLTAFDENVFEPNDAFCSALLTIEGPPTCDLFFVTPDTLDGAGDVTLEWQTTGADISVSIDNGIGLVADADILTVPVTTDTTFTLTAEGSFGTTLCTAPVTVNVADPVVSGGSSSSGGKSINPRCKLSVDQSVVKPGDTVLVSWDSVNAQELKLSSLVGGQSSVLLSTTSVAKSAKGSYAVVVQDDVTFTMDVSRPNRSGDCSVAVTVDDSILGVGLGDTTGLISLRSVPETGFSPTAGFLVVVNVFLAFAAAVVAYVLVVFGQHFAQAQDRSYMRTTIFTPDWVRIARERSLLYSRLVLWKWLAVVFFIISVGGYVVF
ncbi:MAG: hypothetical protein MUF19_00385 [Candidatus Pacebacteria bacterium]|jgi:hypothetical protein|nr:hypothetical protein [Candidatus Paceibacterota bacterium]